MLRPLRSVLLCAALLLAGCAASRPDRIRIVSPVAIRTYGTVGMDAGLEVEYRGRRPLRIEEAEVEFFAGGGSLGRMLLREGFEVPARARTSLRTRWRFDFPDAAAGWVLLRRLERGEFERLDAAVEATVRWGGIRRRVRSERMPVSEFLNIFGRSIGDGAGCPCASDDGTVCEFNSET